MRPIRQMLINAMALVLGIMAWVFWALFALGDRLLSPIPRSPVGPDGYV